MTDSIGIDMEAGTLQLLQTPEAPSIPEEIEASTVDLSSLVAKTVFLQVRYGSIGNQRKVSGANVLTTDADVSLLRVSKTLLESDELEAVRKHDSKLRKWLGNTCLPFSQLQGVLVLPIGFVTQTKIKLNEHAAERLTLVEAFIEAYPKLKDNAQAQLGTLYDASEYPSVEEIKDKFKFSWALVTFSTPTSIKYIDPELFAIEQEKHAQQLKIASEEITAVMRETLFEMVNHLKDRLTPGPEGKPKILKEAAINNLKEFLNNFDLRNVTDDKALAVEVQKVRSLLGGTNANMLRSSDEWKEKIRKGMENVTDSLSGMIEDKTGRKFRE